MNRCYQIYKYKVMTDFEIPGQQEWDLDERNQFVDCKIISDIGPYTPHNMVLSYQDDLHKIILQYASYIIDSDSMLVCSATTDNIISTLYNIPFSIVACYKGDILLHGGGIQHKQNVYAFLGEKGSGKSTLIAGLLKKFQLFSDDTILMSLCDEKISIYNSGNGIVKLNRDSYNTIFKQNPVSFEKQKINPMGKACLKINNDLQYKDSGFTPRLKKIYCIERKKCLKPHIIELENNMKKKFFLINNTVGFTNIEGPFRSKVNENVLLKTIIDIVPMYKLIIPNDLASIENTCYVIAEDICKSEKGFVMY